MSAARAGSAAVKAIKGSRAWTKTAPSLTPKSNAAPTTAAGVDPSHYQPFGSWSEDQIRSAAKDHCMLTWAPSKAKNGLPLIVKGEGVYVYDVNGKEYMDWTSQAVCTNAGQTVSPNVKNAIVEQMEAFPFVYGGMAMCETRARLSKLVSDILPEGLTGCAFPSSGSEANEAAIMMARRFTGKTKIINWYRSYHGGTSNSSAATGDFRRLYNHNPSDFVKAWNPSPNFFEFAGENEEERTKSALLMLEEQIIAEGPQTVASIMFESIPGAAGVLTLPEGYMQGVRAICDKYDILLHIDEVMVGFGRTGKMWGFQHYEGVVPDIVTSAKGLSASVMPISMVAISDKLLEFFEENPMGWGSTYQAHPVAMAGAYASVKDMLEKDTVGHVASLAPIFAKHIEECAYAHPCIKQYRSVGLFGCLDMMTPDGEQPQMFHEGRIPASAKYAKAFNDAGLIGLFRPPVIHIAPPLVITEEELKIGFERQHEALEVLDKELGYV